MAVILQQLEDPLGSAVTLSRLLSSNEKLMLEFANPTLIHRFLDMIRTLGPQPRLVAFFEVINGPTTQSSKGTKLVDFFGDSAIDVYRCLALIIVIMITDLPCS